MVAPQPQGHQAEFVCMHGILTTTLCSRLSAVVSGTSNIHCYWFNHKVVVFTTLGRRVYELSTPGQGDGRESGQRRFKERSKDVTRSI